MGNIAFVFSGQGAQYSGMGQKLYDNFAVAKKIMDEFEIVRPGTINQCFSGTEDELKDTRNTQPCVFAVSMMAAAAIESEGITPSAVAGFSLGEMSALAYSEVFSRADAMRLVTRRGQIMADALQGADSSMVAVMKVDAKKIETIASKYERVYPVNYNCPGQTVVSGEAENLKLFCIEIKEAGGKAIPLKVAGGFHCPFMNEASDIFAKELINVEISAPKYPVWSNLTALPYGKSGADVAETLALQMKSPVLWQKTVENMVESGIKTFIELGPGKTLKGLIEKCSDNVAVYNIEDEISLFETVKAILG